MADPAVIKATANCIVISDIFYDIKSQDDIFYLRADYDQTSRIITIRVSDLTQDKFSDMLIRLGEDLKR